MRLCVCVCLFVFVVFFVSIDSSDQLFVCVILFFLFSSGIDRAKLLINEQTSS